MTATYTIAQVGRPFNSGTYAPLCTVNILPRGKQIEAVAALTEGVSVRAAERLTGVNRGTILSLGVRVGLGCAELHDRLMRDLNVSRIELDEAWSFVAKKQARLTPDDGMEKGDQYVFLAIAGAAKAILSYRVGKRNQEHTSAFIADLRARVLGAPEISSDGWKRGRPTTRRLLTATAALFVTSICICACYETRIVVAPIPATGVTRESLAQIREHFALVLCTKKPF